MKLLFKNIESCPDKNISLNLSENFLIQRNSGRFRKIQRDSEEFKEIQRDSEKFRRIQELVVWVIMYVDQFRRIQRNSERNKVTQIFNARFQRRSGSSRKIQRQVNCGKLGDKLLRGIQRDSKDFREIQRNSGKFREK